MKPWPQLPSDPRLYYFAVPNEIFRSEINASEFSILAYLFSRQMKELPPTNLMTVYKNLGVSRNTMKKYARILESRGLISLQRDRRFLRASVSMRDTIKLTDTLKCILEHAECRTVRFHDLRHRLAGDGPLLSLRDISPASPGELPLRPWPWSTAWT